MRRRWPQAAYREDAEVTAPLARRIFDPKRWRADEPLRVVLIGTDFEIRVWETLLADPARAGDDLFRHRERASESHRRAARSVPPSARTRSLSSSPATGCSAAPERSPAITGGLTRKQAILGWEAGRGAGLAAA